MGSIADGQIAELAEAIALSHERLAEARRAVAEADANYRHWRAIATEDVATRNRKFAEWRAKAVVESQPAFATHKAAIAEARETFDLCDAECKALLAQAMLLAAANGTNPAQWFTSAQEHTSNKGPT